MSSAAEESPPEPVEGAAPAGLETAPHTGATDPSSVEPGSRELEDAAGVWSAAPKDFDEYAAENEASKVFALWQVAPALATPASGASQTESAPADAPESDVWAAAGATERMPSPPMVIEAGPVAPRARSLSMSSESVDMTGEMSALPALPESKSTRNVLIGVAVMVALFVVGGGIGLFWGSPPSQAAGVASGAAPSSAAPSSAAPSAVPLPPAGRPPSIAAAPAVEPVAVAEPVIAPVAEPVIAPVAEPVIAAAVAVAPVAVAPVAVAPVAVAPVAVAPPPPPMRRLRIRTSPATATLTLDGTPVANPYDARLADGSSHTIVASAAGHDSATETVALARDRELTLRLTRTPPPPVAREPAVAARSERPRTRRPASTIRPRAGSTGSSGSSGGFVTESPY